MSNLLEDFSPANYQEWLKLVEKELKTDLEPYLIAEGVEANPFIENIGGDTLPLLSKTTAGWVISQRISGDDSTELNKNILEALEGGVSGISLDIIENGFDFQTAFRDVILSYITVRFCFVNSRVNVELFLLNLEKFIQGKEVNFIFSGLEESYYSKVKGIGIIQVECSPEGVLVDNLSNAKRKIETIVFEHDLDVCLSVPAQENFYLNIAQLKASRIVWDKVIEAYQKPKRRILIFSEIKPQSENPNSQTIAATHQAIAAIIGGADLIEIADIPFESEKYPTIFSPRITRNIHNVLWNEGFLYRVNDPSNGSYFMDDLCKKMIKEIWELFIKDK